MESVSHFWGWMFFQKQLWSMVDLRVIASPTTTLVLLWCILSLVYISSTSLHKNIKRDQIWDYMSASIHQTLPVYLCFFWIIWMESLCLHSSCLLLIKEERSAGGNLLGFSEWRWNVEVDGRRRGSDLLSGWTRQFDLSHLTRSLPCIQSWVRAVNAWIHTDLEGDAEVGKLWPKIRHYGANGQLWQQISIIVSLQWKTFVCSIPTPENALKILFYHSGRLVEHTHIHAFTNPYTPIFVGTHHWLTLTIAAQCLTLI